MKKYQFPLICLSIAVLLPIYSLARCGFDGSCWRYSRPGMIVSAAIALTVVSLISGLIIEIREMIKS